MRVLITIVSAIFMATNTSAIAHHALTIFDSSKVVLIVGTLKQFQWASPHSWIDVLVPAPDGSGVLWPVECAAPVVLVRAGWSKDMMKVGDKISVEVLPLRTGRPGGACVGITVPGGRKFVLDAYRQALKKAGQ